MGWTSTLLRWVRQLMEDVGVRIPRFVNRYTVGFIALALLLIT